jgi:hypothetical protein
MAGLSPREIPRTLVRALVQSRGRVLPALFNALVRVNTRPDLADRALLGRLAEQWRRELLPDYQRLVADAEMRVETANRPVVRARFDALLEVAQRYAVIREEQTRWFTLGWPVLRRCVLRLGEALSQTSRRQVLGSAWSLDPRTSSLSSQARFWWRGQPSDRLPDSR